MNRRGFTLWEVLIILAIVGIFVSIGWNSVYNVKPEPPSETYALFSGEHELRRMVEREGTESSSSGGGFFILGTGAMMVGGQTKPATYVTFAWKHPHDGTFVISTMPVEKIRPSFDASATVPRILFQLHPACAGSIRNYCPEWKLREQGPQAMVDGGYIVYVTLFVREQDWPIKIQLPLS